MAKVPAFEPCVVLDMCSGTARPIMQSAAWRISLWAALAFACCTMVVFVFLHQFVAGDIQRRTDAWLAGEAGVLSDVASRTPKDALNRRLVREVAELASREVPHKRGSAPGPNDSVFFLQTSTDGTVALWVGAGDVNAHLAAVRTGRLALEKPTTLHINGFAPPFRVVCVKMANGSQIYLGLSERDERRVLWELRIRFVLLWLLIVLIGSAIVYYSTRRVLGHIREITEAASRLGEDDLSSRVPTTRRNDEVAQLAITLNRMLDRIENTIHQLHTITGSLTHDIRSPLTAVRARLEMALTRGREEESESIVSAIEDMDRLTEFLDKSLDVAEARANALRINRVPVDLDELLRVMIDLYQPGMSDKGLHIQLCSAGPLEIYADAALLHRMMANLFDNEAKHVPPSCTVKISLSGAGDTAMLVIEDSGPGFDSEISAHLFERRIKGRNSSGHGLGLAFVEAVVRAHGGTIEASNRVEGGARLALILPRSAHLTNSRAPLTTVVTG
jgi:signal transduction histidine kinase